MNELLYAGLCFITAGVDPCTPPVDQAHGSQGKPQSVHESANQCQPPVSSPGEPNSKK